MAVRAPWRARASSSAENSVRSVFFARKTVSTMQVLQRAPDDFPALAWCQIRDRVRRRSSDRPHDRHGEAGNQRMSDLAFHAPEARELQARLCVIGSTIARALSATTPAPS